MTLVSSEILGYIVQYWKILDPEVCQFVNLAIRRFGQFFRFITALVCILALAYPGMYVCMCIYVQMGGECVDA